MKPEPILLVEDNPSDIELTQRALKKSRIANELVVARDGEEALDYLFGTGLFAHRDVFDLPVLILLDLKLPWMTGLEVLRRIREDPRTKRVCVAILTTSNERRDIGTGYDLGANSYIQKPVDFKQLAAAVEQLGLCWHILNERMTGEPPDRVG